MGEIGPKCDSDFGCRAAGRETGRCSTCPSECAENDCTGCAKSFAVAEVIRFGRQTRARLGDSSRWGLHYDWRLATYCTMKSMGSRASEIEYYQDAQPAKFASTLINLAARPRGSKQSSASVPTCDFPGASETLTLHCIMLSAGIVGLPNIGKSTLFNAFTRTHKAPAENYPFARSIRNISVVIVPDPRTGKDQAELLTRRSPTRVCGHRWTRQKRESAGRSR